MPATLYLRYLFPSSFVKRFMSRPVSCSEETSLATSPFSSLCICLSIEALRVWDGPSPSSIARSRSIAFVSMTAGSPVTVSLSGIVRGVVRDLQEKGSRARGEGALSQHRGPRLPAAL